MRYLIGFCFGVVVTSLFVSFILNDNAIHKERSFMASCAVDGLKPYECMALWRGNLFIQFNSVKSYE